MLKNLKDVNSMKLHSTEFYDIYMAFSGYLFPHETVFLYNFVIKNIYAGIYEYIGAYRRSFKIILKCQGIIAF